MRSPINSSVYSSGLLNNRSRRFVSWHAFLLRHQFLLVFLTMALLVAGVAGLTVRARLDGAVPEKATGPGMLNSSFLPAPGDFRFRLFARALTTSSVTTDRQDYHPGETVNISGAGFQAGETVSFQVLHVGGSGDSDSSTAHQPWYVGADVNGDLQTTWTVPADEDKGGATLQLTAAGLSSGSQASSSFTTYGANDGSANSSPATASINVSTTACISPISNLVAWYPGQNNANDIVGNVTGQATGPALFTAGEVGQAFDLNGTNYFTIPSTNIPVGNASRTMEFWVNVRNTSPDHEILVYGSFAFHQAFGIDVDGTTGAGNVMLQVFTYGDDISGLDTGVPLNQLMHVGVTYEGTTRLLKIYINGVLKETKTAAGDLNTTATPVSIGRFFNNFNGILDEVQIYNRALSAGEISSAYNAGSAGTCLPPVTTTTAQNATVSSSLSAQSVTFNASVASPSATVNSGSVQFSVATSSGTPAGSPVSGNVSAGLAGAVFTLPAGTSPQTLTITASYTTTSALDFQSSVGTSTLTVINNAPVASNSSATTNEDTSVVIPLQASDQNGNALTYTVVSGPTNGVLSGSGASRTYLPAVNYNGPDSFTFKANDGLVDSNVATVNINVVSVNDAPVMTAPAPQTAFEAASQAFNLGSFADPDGGPWAVDVNWGDGTAHTAFSASSAGSLGTQNHAYVPEGIYIVTVKVTDGTNLSDSKTFQITVADSTPVVKAQNSTVTVDESQNATNAGTFSDPSAGEAVTVTVSAGTVTQSGGTIQYVTSIGGLVNPIEMTFDNQHNLFVAEDGGAAVSKFSPSGSLITRWGIGGAATGIAVDSAGNVYVASKTRNDIQVFPNSGGGATRTIGGGILNGPHGIAIDSSDNVYVSDASNNRVVVLSSTGTLLRQWGGFNFPQGIALDSIGNVYVTNRNTNQLRKFTSGGTFITQWGVAGNTAGVGIDSADEVFVSNFSTPSVQVFTSNGAPLYSFGTTGSGAGQFNLPHGVEFDSNGNIWVADWNNGRVQKWSIPNSWSWSMPTNDGPAGSQTITITATDAHGLSSTKTFQLTVNNVLPTATFSNGVAVNQGSNGSVSFTSPSDPSSADTAAGFHYAYDFDNNGTFESGDGTYSGSSTSATATVPASFLATAGARTIRGRIIDKDNGFTDYTTSISVNNVAPVVDAGPDGTATQGSPYSSSGSFTDPGSDTWTATVNYGDGTGVQSLTLNANKTFALAHTYSASGFFAITVTVNDGLATGSDPAKVTVLSTTCAPPPANMVGWWKGDGNTNDIISGANGTLQNGATYATGKVGQAFSFSGTNASVNIGVVPQLKMQSSVSMDAWIFPTGPGTSGLVGGIIINREGEYEVARYPDGTIQWAFANTVPAWNFHNTGSIAPLNQWTHVAVTYAAGVVKTYNNGVLVETFNGAGNIGDVLTSQNEFRIGGRQGLEQGFTGRIDEVEVFARTLNASEIQSIYLSDMLGKCLPPTTVTSVTPVSTNYSTNSQSINLAASVTPASNGPVNDGTVKFTVTNTGNAVVGSTVTAAVTGGNAGGSFTVPAGLAPQTLNVTALYVSSVPDYQTSTGAGTLTIGKADQAITFAPLSDKTYGEADFAVSGSSNSGLPVSFSAAGNCTVSGATVHITGAGSCTVTASQSGNSNYNAAPDIARSFTIAKANPVIAWADPTDILYGTALGATQLNAAASFHSSPLAGGFAYLPAAGQVLNAGNGQALGTTFTPTDTNNFNTVVATTHINVLKATPMVNVTGGTFIYDGLPHPATAVAVGYNGLPVTINSMTITYTPGGAVEPKNAGSYSITATFVSGDSNYTDAAGTGAVTITRADANCTVNGYTGKYDASAHGATGSCAGVAADPSAAGSNLALGAQFTNVPGGTANWTFTGGNNYNDQSGTAAIVINRASSTTTIDCTAGAPFTYTGSAITPCTATATGVGALNVSVTPVNYSNNVSAGAAIASATYGGDANHDGSVGNDGFTITKASSSVTVNCPASETYAGSAIEPCTASFSGAGGLSGTLTPTYMNNVNSGSATASATYGGDPNHDGSTGNGGFTINQASSTTTIDCTAGAPFTYTGSPITPCTAAATGAGGLNVLLTPVNYTNNINAGAATASATYGGDANHTASGDSKTFDINQAPVTITGGGGTAVYDGSVKTPSACVVTGAYKGDLTCANNPASVGPDVSTTVIVPVIAGTGLTNFDITSVNGSASITQATSSTVIACPASVVYNGAAQTPCTVAVTGAGDLSLTPTPTYSANTNVGTVSVSYNFAGDGNHTASSDSKTFDITKAFVIATAGSGSNMYDGSTHSPSTCVVSGAYTGALSCVNDPATVASGVGNTTISPITSGAGLANFVVTLVDGSYTISQATSIVTVTCPLEDQPYTGLSQTTCTASFATSEGGSGPLSVSYSINTTDVGTVTASATYGGDFNHAGSSNAGSFKITKATTTVTVIAADAIFDGSPHGGTAVATGVNGLNETLIVTYVGRNGTVYLPITDAPTNAGDYTASASYPGTDNYTDGAGSKDFTIGKASSATTVSCPADPFIYSGTAFTPCMAMVTGDGGLSQTASVSYADNINAGTATASATFAGDANHYASDNSQTFSIAKADQSINFGALNPTTFGAADFSINASATSGLPVSLDVTSGTCTLATGTSPSTVHITGAGNCSIAASQAGSGNFNAATSVNRTFSIAKAAQVITFAPLGNVTFGAADFNVSATGGASGNAVTFAATGNCTVSGSTVHITGAGACTIRASQAGNGNYDPAADVSRSFNIAKAESAVTVTAPAFVANGGSVTISGVLTGVANAPLAGQTVTFSIGTQSCTATTTGTGAASCTISGVNQPTGPGLSITVTFSGNSNYNGSGVSTSTFVYSYAAGSGAAFVIGDRNAAVGTNVIYWGAQWTSLNTLSGGAAPAAFKGFANRSSTTPASVGATWTTDPGNSSNPPAAVPAYMAVIVASTTAKSGSTISGNTVRMVIVRTNTGYAADPGHAGTGTVIALLP